MTEAKAAGVPTLQELAERLRGGARELLIEAFKLRYPRGFDGSHKTEVDKLLGIIEIAQLEICPRAAILRALDALGGAEKALEKAAQMASICCDWNLDEVEIDGKMVRSHELEREFRTALAQIKAVTQ